MEIIHRDLAARNILLKGGRALVSDFGMARTKAGSVDEGNTKSEVGPLKWMVKKIKKIFNKKYFILPKKNKIEQAPESLLQKKYSTKTDVFSYGVVCWEIVSQQDPWPGLDGIQATHKLLAG